MNDSEGELVVKIARKAVEAEALDKDPTKLDMPEGFREKMGVFVTLNTFPDKELRGCIGYPEPVYSLGSALVRAAQGACHDPRFPPLRGDEVDGVTVEVTILTPPEEVKADRKELPAAIMVGRDGLIVEKGPFKGLLLPQVPVEWEWDEETFLCHTCMKAGLTPDCWLDSQTKIFKFQGEVFAEDRPRGSVSRKPLE
ncbi:MAG TPA: TIGR00296 family protein [Methanomassiliicoccales archaeon]|nr:TIGR00296 family protein [Methanomassiliicoccales archaeon]